jgi:addiction module RelB/DinJ family antitoxin
MATVVVSGRVDEEVKRQADRIIEQAGSTPGDVIRTVWETIAVTGTLPISQEREDEFKRKRQAFKEFMDCVSALPSAPDWFATMSDGDLRDMKAASMLEKERSFVGGDLHVSPAH